MALGTHSKFYYGHVVDETNYAINFKEGDGPELTAIIRQGPYSLSEYVKAIELALNEIGDLTYIATLNRDNRYITVSSDGEFSFLFNSGSLKEISAAELMGFEPEDFEGITSITSSFGSGEVYFTQFWLQDYVAPGDSQSLIDAVVNTSANGDTEVVRFGNQSFIEFSLKYITDNFISAGEKILRYNSQGVSRARSFMEYIITKGRFEFMPDEDNSNEFYKIAIDKTPESSIGTAFKLKEQVAKGTPGLFETGVLTFKIFGGV